MSLPKKALSMRRCLMGVALLFAFAGGSAIAQIAPVPISAAAQATEAALSTEYIIGASDKLAISVFQVEDLKFEKIQVDASGNISLPLIGTVAAAGKTTAQVAQEIASRLQQTYLQDPKVTVVVEEALSQKITVDGSVIQPGVYMIAGETSLLQAVALAKGPDNKYADLKRVLVFRNVAGQRTVAEFDLKAIRSGKSPDPAIVGNDIVVVGSSAVKGAWREVVGILPGLGVFRAY